MVAKGTRTGPGARSACLALACLAAGFLAGAALAQPAPDPLLDPEIDPAPFDPRLELRELFRRQMPTYWWFEEPQFNAGVFTIVVHVPKEWRGNPGSAVMRFCPDRGDAIWKGVERFYIRPFYRDRPWPTFECRP